MHKLFSTDGMPLASRFTRWREICEDRIVLMHQEPLDSGPFHASIDAVDVGPLALTRFKLSNLRAETTPSTVRHPENKADSLFVSSVISGTVASMQNDQAAVDVTGDLSVRDPSTPWALEHKGHTDVLALEVSRDRLERMLGPARNFAGLTLSGHLPNTVLTRSFLANLTEVGGSLSGAAADRIASVAVDLIVASVAERMAQDTPKELQDTVAIQRAKAFIQANLADPNLDPPLVAAAIGTSLRHLHSLFASHGRHVADWIWQRRLEAAAYLLADPAYLHRQLGSLAFTCGFTSQAHFSRRFREAYGMSPREYRQETLTRSRSER